MGEQEKSKSQQIMYLPGDVTGEPLTIPREADGETDGVCTSKWSGGRAGGDAIA